MSKPGPRTPSPISLAWPDAPGVLSTLLCNHYRTHRRDLPWRRTRDPYAIWVSEVMLQQTQVETVCRYYTRFLQRFPDVRALAEAPQQDVMAAWSGLGYYRRARLMHAAAAAVMERHGGQFPSTHAHIRALPGVGEYTAGALWSIAYGQPAAAVDGNVQRVISRVLALSPAQATAALFSQAALALHGGQPPADITQGLMELGATVCTPAAPQCTVCPWSGRCKAQAQGAQLSIPPPKVRAPRQDLDVVCALTTVDGGGVMLAARGQDGLFGGLWELPGAALQRAPQSALTAAGLRTLRAQLARAHPYLAGGRLLCITRRTLTHRNLSMYVLAAKVLDAAAASHAGLKPVAPNALADAPLASATRVALRQAQAALQTPGLPGVA